MSNPSPQIITQTNDNDLGQNMPEEEKKEASVTIDDHIISETKDSASSEDRPMVFVSSIMKDEPIVTRRELWSYYR